MKLIKEIEELIDNSSIRFIDALMKSNIRTEKIERMVRENLKDKLNDKEIERVMKVIDEAN